MASEAANWRDGIPTDELLTDDELREMRAVAEILPNLKFDFKRAYEPEKPFGRVTISRILRHHHALITEIEHRQRMLSIEDGDDYDGK